MLVTGEEVASALFGCPDYPMDALINSFQLTPCCTTMCLKQGMLCSFKGADTASLRLTWLEDLVGEGAKGQEHSWQKGIHSTVFQCGAFCVPCVQDS